MNERTPQSRQLIENGYLDWLCGEIGELAKAKFASAGDEDIQALSRAKVAFELVAEVRQIVRTNANRT